jgi:5-methylcytosine-specific restriction endonuclease McrA
LFTLDFRLRLDIQHELFGAPNFQQENQKFYQWCWDNSIKNCQETGLPLYDYSAVYISHIISRGSDRRVAIDPRNINILSFEMHQKWESLKNNEMNIFPTNKIIIQMLKNDYNVI